MKGHKFCMSLNSASQILYERCYRCIMREATDSLLTKCNFFMKFLSGYADFGTN